MRHWGKTMQRFLVDHVKSIYSVHLVSIYKSVSGVYMQEQTHVHVTLSSAHIHIAVSAVAHVHARVVVVHREIMVV